jgi:SAGA-associated factor 73
VRYNVVICSKSDSSPSPSEAALDANAPVEDEDEGNTGPVDSDEETAAVMNALSHWNPHPVVLPPVLQPIKRTYQLARLHEQLQMATNGGRTNIFKVVGFGAQRLGENHIGLMDGEDAQGELDSAVVFSAAGRASSFSVPPPPQRRPSVASRG